MYMLLFLCFAYNLISTYSFKILLYPLGTLGGRIYSCLNHQRLLTAKHIHDSNSWSITKPNHESIIAYQFFNPVIKM